MLYHQRFYIAVRCLGIIFASFTFLIFVSRADATKLEGAWANDQKVCSKIFVKSRNRIIMSSKADFFGSDFIIDGDEIRGKLSTCHIKTRRQDGAITYLLTECATDIALSQNQFSIHQHSNGQ